MVPVLIQSGCSSLVGVNAYSSRLRQSSAGITEYIFTDTIFLGGCYMSRADSEHLTMSSTPTYARTAAGCFKCSTEKSCRRPLPMIPRVIRAQSILPERCLSRLGNGTSALGEAWEIEGGEAVAALLPCMA